MQTFIRSICQRRKYKMHKHMAVDIESAATLTSLPNAITVVYPTSQSPIECLLWSTFSLLLRANVKDLIKHFTVVINGPDKRTGDPANQDLKLAFLQDLQRLKWWHVDKPKDQRDMPISIL